MESIHGPQVSKHILYSIFITLSAITIGPVAEEAVFRGPVLWFVEKSQYSYALLALAISSIVFALCHVGESYGKYRDGSSFKKTRSMIQSTLIGGVLYGVFVIITGSLWPGIFLHVIWNVSAIIIDTFYKKKFNVFALSLQR
ncbi:MAG: CPBP family intramembrane metalloprotease [bacterium]|nr:CPBP family intramembrane metalloprotease [bacterium]